MGSSSGYRSWIYLCCVLTGAAGLIFQIVWQRYLSFLVGSEARSASLIVAFFLLGVAVGYQHWGKITEQKHDRRQLLRFYGWIELGIGAYAILFPIFFGWVKEACYLLPNSFLVDILATLTLLFTPTFLMGATIPLLTAVVPTQNEEVHHCHAMIYGLNTLGAFVGTFVAGFFLIHQFGLPTTLILGGLIDLIVGAIFLKNRLQGEVKKRGEIESIENKFGARLIFTFVFVTGAAAISFEILFIRILGLSVGSGHFVFPVVVGIFVLGLAIGSLTVRNKIRTVETLFRELYLLVFLLVGVYLSIPFWPYWLNNARVRLVNIPENYVFYLILITLFMALFLLPFLRSMGRLLPLGYALLDKTTTNYGRQCGRLYFFNATGTVLGAIVLGYLLLYWLDLDAIFKINLFLIVILTGFMSFKQKKIRSTVICLPLAIGVIVLPAWNRSSHHLGLFRNQSINSYNFAGWFRTPIAYDEFSEVSFFEDGPNSSVTVLSAIKELPSSAQSASIVVNGKSDSSTLGDLSTLLLLGSIPYLYSAPKTELSAAIIGMGTGVTAGMLGQCQDIGEVKVIEISPTVIKANTHFQDYNFNILSNEKIEIIETDAFKYLSRNKKKLDLITSAPSNPWVMGVENLFTREFYSIVKDSLAEEGVFFQWFQTYETSNEIIGIVLSNLTESFEYASIFKIGSVDIGILASNQPFQTGEIDNRFNEKPIRDAHSRIGLFVPDQIDFINLYSSPQTLWLAQYYGTRKHTIETPILGQLASRSRFLERNVNAYHLVPRETRRLVRVDPIRKDALARMAEEFPRGIPGCRRMKIGIFPEICNQVNTTIQAFREYRGMVVPVGSQLKLSLGVYAELRFAGMIDTDLNHLEKIAQVVSENPFQLKNDLEDLVTAIVSEFSRENQSELAHEWNQTFQRRGLISERSYREIESSIGKVKELIAKGILNGAEI